MKFDLSKEVTDLYGKPVMLNVGDAPTAATLAGLAIEALMATPQGEKPDGQASLQKFDVALKIRAAALAGTPVSLSLDEASLVLACSGKVFNPLAHGRLAQALDPETRGDEDAEAA